MSKQRTQSQFIIISRSFPVAGDYVRFCQSKHSYKTMSGQTSFAISAQLLYSSKIRFWTVGQCHCQC